jgi:hypothetical protein
MKENALATEVHPGHIYHVAGSPKITEAGSALVEVPQGALVVENGVITYRDFPLGKIGLLCGVNRQAASPTGRDVVEQIPCRPRGWGAGAHPDRT